MTRSILLSALAAMLLCCGVDPSIIDEDQLASGAPWIQTTPTSSGTCTISASTCAASFTANVTAGHLLVAAVRRPVDASTLTSITDSLGNSWTCPAAAAAHLSGSHWMNLCYTFTRSSGAETVTAHFGAGIVSSLAVTEYSGAGALDKAAAASGSTATASTSFFTTTAANELIVGAFGCATNYAVTAGVGFTARYKAHDIFFEDKFVTTTGSYAASAKCEIARWTAVALSFAASAPVPAADGGSLPRADSAPQSRADLGAPHAADGGTPSPGAAHPNFLLNQSEIDQLKTKIQTAGYVRDNWLKTKQFADWVVGNGSNYTDAMNHNACPSYAGRPLSALGMAYALTDNVTYANRVRQILMAHAGPRLNCNESGIDGFNAEYYMAFLFSYDVIYNAPGVLSATDKSSIESWFKCLYPIYRAQADWDNLKARGFIQSATKTHGLKLQYVPPEWQGKHFFQAALGYVLQDKALIDYAVEGNGYPYDAFDFQVRPTATQNPFALKLFLHYSFSPEGASSRLFSREGTFGYYLDQVSGLMYAAEAAWHRGVDLWHYRDPTTDANIKTIMDWNARYSQSKAYYFHGDFSASNDMRYLFPLVNSHFKDAVSLAAVTYTGGPVAKSQRDATRIPDLPGSDGNWWGSTKEDCFGRVVNLLGAIDRSGSIASDTANLGPIKKVPNDITTLTVGGARAFLVTASPSTVKAGSPFSVTIRALQSDLNTTAQGFAGTVYLWSSSWSPVYNNYMDSKPLTYNPPRCDGKPGCEWYYDDYCKPPDQTVVNAGMDSSSNASGMIPVTFAASDLGQKTVSVTLKNGGVGSSTRLEAVHGANPLTAPATSCTPWYGGTDTRWYPRLQAGDIQLIRGWSNRIFVTP